MEAELANHLRDLDKRFYGLKVKDLQSLAYRYAEINRVDHRFNRQKKMAGRHWIRDFAKRHGISLRNPEKCSLARVMGFNKVQCDRFFDNLKICYENHNIAPHRIFNMDETGMSTVPNKTPKVFAPKGKRSVARVVSAERGQTVTAVCCMGATGTWVPPALIFPRKRMKEELFYGAPSGTLKLVTESGYMNSELFIEWLRHFQNYVKSTEDDPVLLLLDNHVSHCTLDGIHFCREHKIILLTLPPHASYKIQPLDKCYFGPLKTAFSVECDNWIVGNPGKCITLKQVAALFKAAYTRTATIQICEKAFSSTGLYPYNPNVFTEEDFVPAEVTDIPNPGEEMVQVATDIDIPVTTREVDEPRPSTSKTVDDNYDDEDNIPLAHIAQRTPTKSPKDAVQQKDNIRTNIEPTNINDAYFNVQSSPTSFSTAISVITPQMIHPLPKERHEQHRRTHGKKSEILSSTPYKDQLIQNLKDNVKGANRSIAKTTNTETNKIHISHNKAKNPKSNVLKTNKASEDISKIIPQIMLFVLAAMKCTLVGVMVTG